MLQSRSVYTFQDAEPVHIFEDLTGRRQKILPAIGYMTLLILVIFVSDLIWRISNLPTLAELNPAPIFQEVPSLTPFPNDLPPSLIYLQTDTAATCGSKASPAQDMRRTVAAFVPADNPTAASALASHCGDLNLILAQAFVFGAPDGTVEPLVWLDGYQAKFPHPFLFEAPLELPAGTKIGGLAAGAKVGLLRKAE